MKILVTGGAGFIGSNLVEALLAAGHSVRILDNFSAGDRRNLEGFEGDLEVMEGTVLDPEHCAAACQGVDAVSHQAAFGSAPRSIESPELYSLNNLHGFVVLCNQARLAGIHRIVYASTSLVYGDSPLSPKQENIRGRAMSPYAASKQGNEDFSHAFTNAYGMTMVGFRYFNVFGPKQNPKGGYAAVIPQFITRALLDEPSTIHGDGEQSRDFTYVENVVQANLLALTREVEPGSHILNIACGVNTSVNALYGKIYEQVGCSKPPLQAEVRKGDLRDSLADISQARELLGYRDPVGLDEGIARTIEWYRSHPGRW
ncbi:MAG: NAD-dependent epimerase/dehydratase family protein [Fibrobacterota bacterium]|nr:MAG: NAD-dependent epimerase/dehydratase family protein [Fibrobacterota bacterium]